MARKTHFDCTCGANPSAKDAAFQLRAAHHAISRRFSNAPSMRGVVALAASLGVTDADGLPAPTASHMAMLTGKLWPHGYAHLTVFFLEEATPTLRDRILRHMNAWSATADVSFRETKSQTEGMVRIAFADDEATGGYWSYVGTDIELVKDVTKPTMNLQDFTDATSEQEFRRVVRHEAGHALGCVHEHLRRQEIAQIDPAAAIRYYYETQGWNEETTRQQVLTPVPEELLVGTRDADSLSIMCYQIPTEIT